MISFENSTNYLIISFIKEMIQFKLNISWHSPLSSSCSVSPRYSRLVTSLFVFSLFPPGLFLLFNFLPFPPRFLLLFIQCVVCRSDCPVTGPVCRSLLQPVLITPDPRVQTCTVQSVLTCTVQSVQTCTLQSAQTCTSQSVQTCTSQSVQTCTPV